MGMDAQYRAEKEKNDKYVEIIDKILFMCDSCACVNSMILKEFIEDSLKKI